MKVLLAQPVENLGETGEIVEVKAGYARNYLYPQKLAVEPTAHNAQGLQKAKIAREAELRDREEKAKVLKAQLDGQTFTFQRTAQEEGVLYGSVRMEDIASAIAERTGHALERDRVRLGAPLDHVGTYPVKVSIYKDIISKITVVVEAENVVAKPATKGAARPETDGQEETETEGDDVA